VSRPRLWAALACAVLLGGCSSPAGPSGKGPIVNSVSPATGSTFGGTAVTILGGGFASGATVTIGGAAATDVTVSGTTSLTATAPQHAAGAVDVVVTVNGASTTLSGAFTYVPPQQAANAPPTIVSLTARGTRTNEPAGFADKSETINVTATVTDAETPPSSLTYAWTATLGTFSGTGAAVTWTAPASVSSPTTATLTLTVTETYTVPGGNGLPVTATNTATKTVTVSLHDTSKEVGDMAYQFLDDFSHTSITDASYILRNFSDTCKGKADEANDIAYNRAHFTITSYTLGTPSVKIGFAQGCPVHNVPGDACANVHASWTGKDLDANTVGTATGTDQVSAIYLTAENRWALCGSDWLPDSSTTGLWRRFMR
jgi:hypothetical protein